MKIINQTQSICAKCQKNVPAQVLVKKGRVFIESDCPKHGKVLSDHVWDDEEIYRGLRSLKLAPEKATQTLVDVTNRCNLNCKVCFARSNEQTKDKFRSEELDDLLEYDRIFISGGEPTLREDLPDIIGRCVQNGQKPVIFSNGIKLANYQYAKKLKEAGLRSVLLQLDTLRESDCEYIRGQKLVKIKVRALHNLRRLNIPVSIWTVAVRNKNSADLKKIAGFVFRFPNVKTFSAIPIWRIGRFDPADFIPPSELLEQLENDYPGLTKQEFIQTTRLMCNIDRLLIHLNWKKGRVFGVCMIKSLVFDYHSRYIALGKIINVKYVNGELEKFLENKKTRPALMRLLGKIFYREGLVNFIKNKYFRAVIGRLTHNLRYIPSKRYLLVNPFKFITVGIYPSPQNIDLDFIKTCNTYALNNSDHQLSPACLHYIREEQSDKKIKENNQ